MRRPAAKRSTRTMDAHRPQSHPLRLGGVPPTIRPVSPPLPLLYTTAMADGGTILVTAFEPSGDALAAPMIRGLLRENAGLRVLALGGELMRDAGAELIEQTCDRAVMLLGAVSQLRAHRRRLHRLRTWLNDHKINLLVPVDSPAANWGVCRLVRDTQPAARIAHLAAPQLWAWAPRRIHKLRRLTDMVMCLFPFEPDWFQSRGVPARLVGHPLYDETLHTPRTPLNDDVALASSKPRLTLLPGSREQELDANWPTMLCVVRRLLGTHRGLAATVAVTSAEAANRLRRLTEKSSSGEGGWPKALRAVHGQTDAAIAWADAVLAVSGTATLQVAAHHKPMVVFYNINAWTWNLLGRWLVHTRTFSLPNLIAGVEHATPPIPEYVPHFGDPEPLVAALTPLLDDPSTRVNQQGLFRDISQTYANQPYVSTVCREVQSLLAGPVQ